MTLENQGADPESRAPTTPSHLPSQDTPAQVDAKEYAESIVATMPIALLVMETNLRVRTASQAFYDTFQVTPENTIGQLIYNLGNGQWNIPKLRTLLEEILPGNNVFTNYEVEHTFEGIGHRTMLLNGRRLDTVQLILLVIVDISERKQIEEVLQESHQHLEATLAEVQGMQVQLIQQERLSAVGGLAAGIAHDFNNILSIIMLHVELGLRTSHLPPNHRRHLETIAQQAKRAAHLVQQMLDFGRLTAIETTPLDLVAFLNEEIELLQRTLSADIKIDLSYGSDEYIVNADLTRIQQILTNLVLNGCDAMQGSGELSISLERLQLVSQADAPLPGMEVGAWIQVSVSDTGTGIPPEVLPHLFEPFFTTKAPQKGTGLGLAQVYGLVKQHHGHIDVQTQYGGGTTFIIYLPALESTPSGILTGATVELPLGQGQTILIVEDHASLREVLVDTLELLNYRPLAAANGYEALAILEQQADEVALVLSDLMMPQMGGRELFRTLRQRGLSQPVVMLSGHAKEAEMQALRAQGLAAWLPKPPTIQQLAVTLARVLQQGGK